MQRRVRPHLHHHRNGGLRRRRTQVCDTGSVLQWSRGVMRGGGGTGTRSGGRSSRRRCRRVHAPLGVASQNRGSATSTQHRHLRRHQVRQ
jgi:hypothetical protein